MQDKQLFEYAVIRVVPRVEREEFINVGIIVYCQGQNFLQTEFFLDKQKLLCMAPDLEMEELEKRLEAFQEICEGGKKGGMIGTLPMSARFRWLTATRSTIIQTSKVHPGLCEHPKETLKALMDKLVN
jgi:hypothetical protein